MDLDLLWKAVIVVIGGTLLLRLAGRKSISQMTLAQTVIMVGIGSLLVQPIVGRSIWGTLAVGAALVLTLIVIEYAQVKSDKIESFITGRSKILIENGLLQEQNLKKLRLPVDQLEMTLRQQSVSKISDVKWATLEPNGKVGFELKEEAKPATKKDIQSLQQDLQQLKRLLGAATTTVNSEQPSLTNNQNLFAETAREGHIDEPPHHLQ